MIVRSLVLAAALSTLVGAGSLSTDYSKDRTVRFSFEASLDLETTSQKSERDGQPVEPRGSMSMKSSRTLGWTDHVAERDGNTPKKVVRSFGDTKQSTTAIFGDREMPNDQDGALSNVKVELTRGEGDAVEAKAVEGDAPSEALEGQRLELVLDAFLPDGDDAEWELDNAAVRRALVLDLQKAMFPPPEPSGGGDGDGGGRRGPPRGFGGGSTLGSVEWEGTGKLTDKTEEYDGATCQVIDLALEGKATIEDSPGGWGRGRAFGAVPAPIPETTVEAKLEGRLLFDKAKRLPVRLELRGKVEQVSKREGEYNGSTFKSETTMEGELLVEATVSEETE
jgi:hypothetical protein